MRIKITDRSTVVTTEQMSLAVATMNLQLLHWKLPWFGPDHRCYANPTSWDWEVVVLDDADQAGALGYHDVTPDGRPYGKVFVKVCQQYNVPWISCLSHEVLELVADPGANQWVNDPSGQLWAFEMCDAVQDHLYTIGGVEVSDFVYPNYFIPGSKPPYDHMRILTAPFTIKDGYSIVAKMSSITNIFGLLRGPQKKTTAIGDVQLAQRPDKLFPASRTQRRLHAFDGV